MGRVGNFQNAWRHGLAFFAAIGILVAASRAEPPRSPRKPIRRSPTPVGPWDKATADTFFDDAFSQLAGPRPAFAAAAAAAGSAATGAAAAIDAPAEAGFTWSSLISEETLTDEIKDMQAVVAAAVERPSDFKGGGFDRAREAFSSIALSFGVIAAYDKDIRWKKQAATARDLFARVGFNCKVGTDQSFAESKARLADLNLMLDGDAPQGKPDRDEDFLWSQVAARPALMTRLEAAEKAADAALANADEFSRQAATLAHQAEIVAAIGEAIQQRDFEDHDDDTYRGYAAAMRRAAIEARDAAREKDYEAARSAAGELRKSCNACHGEYRG